MYPPIAVLAQDATLEKIQGSGGGAEEEAESGEIFRE